MKREPTVITADHAESRMGSREVDKLQYFIFFLVGVYVEKKQRAGPAQVNQLGGEAEQSSTREGFTGTASCSGMSCLDGAYDIPVCSPSPPLTSTQSLSKTLPHRRERLLLWQTFQGEGGSIQHGEGAEQGKQTAVSERWGRRRRKDISRSGAEERSAR